MPNPTVRERIQILLTHEHYDPVEIAAIVGVTLADLERVLVDPDFVPAGAAVVAGAAPDVYDDFSADRLSGYVADSGSSVAGLTVVGGVLRSGDALAHMFHSSFEVADSKQLLKVNPGASASRMVILTPKWVDNNNLLKVQLYNDGASGLPTLYQVVAGVQSILVTNSTGPVPSGRPGWLVTRMTGNTIVVEYWTTDPHLGGSPAETHPWTLSGAAIAALGAGVLGHPGIGLSGYASGFATTDWTAADWTVVGGGAAPPRTGF